MRRIDFCLSLCGCCLLWVGMGSGTSSADEPSRAKNPLIRAYEDLLSQSELDDDQQVDDVRRMLHEADEALTRIKAENRAALRQVNRQTPTLIAARTNMILVLIDDLDLFPTNTDETEASGAFARLQREGMTFSDYHAGSSFDPDAFWTIHSGRFAAGLSRNDLRQPLIASGQGSLLSVMWHAGFSTGYFGSWPLDGHIGPLQCDADTFVGVVGDEASQVPFPSEYVVNDIPQKANRDGGAAPFVWSTTTLQALAAMERETSGRPYFHVIRYHAVDLPPSELEGLDLPADLDSQQRQRRARALRVEREVGQLLDYLDRRGTAKNTLFVVAGESPTDSTEAPRDHAGVKQADLRTPLMVRWPVIVPAGKVSRQTCGAWDLLPTFAGVARDLRFVSRSQGTSLYPALTGRDDPASRLLYWQIPVGDEHWQVVRLDQWKAILPPDSKAVQLFDLQADPEESTDVSGDHPEVISRVLRSN